MNAKEVNAASKYIYPADHASLYFFNEEVFSRTPNLLLKLKKKENIMVDGEKGVVVKFECKNVSQFFVNYMQNLNMLDINNCIVDTILVKETGEGKKITFNWAKIKGENLYLASIKAEQDKTSSFIYSNKSEKSDILGELKGGKKIVIDGYSEDAEWVQCFTIDHTCRILQGYMKKNSAKSYDSLFFSLGIFEGLSLLIAFIILVVIAFPLIYIGSLFDLVFGRGGIIGIVIGVALILGLIGVAYLLLENILYELFLIKLPLIKF